VRSPLRPGSQAALAYANLLQVLEIFANLLGCVRGDFVAFQFASVNRKTSGGTFLVNKAAGAFTIQPFQKLDDPHGPLKGAALLPFEGLDALYYLELRALIDEKNERARAGEDQRTFVTMDLRQGLSSYPQLSQSHILNGDFESARHYLRIPLDDPTQG
jgi:hypothetical protein